MLTRLLNYLSRKIYYLRNRKKFAYLSPNAIVQKLLRLDGCENISIGNQVTIQKMTWLGAVPLTGAGKCKLTIGDGSVIGHFNHIFATGEITIGKKVLTADKVYISDNQHQYDNIEKAILDQPIKQFPPISIGDGTWIGENVCVMGASIGKNCIIGANSVVNKSIPDYCIAVGAPAKVIKKYNIETKKWEKV